MAFQETLQYATPGRCSVDMTHDVAAVVARAGVATGLCHLFCRHTSASVMICENADPAVRQDLERWLADMVPDGSSRFVHDDEGPDDMPAHVRSILTGMDVTVPVTQGRLNLGTWQGLYLYEHRHAPHRRQVVVTVV